MKKYLSLLLCSFILGCAASPTASTDPTQAAIDATYNSAVGIDAAIKAADVAVKAGTLKGQDGANVIAGLRAAKMGLDSAIAALPPASGATK